MPSSDFDDVATLLENGFTIGEVVMITLDQKMLNS